MVKKKKKFSLVLNTFKYNDSPAILIPSTYDYTLQQLSYPFLTNLWHIIILFCFMFLTPLATGYCILRLCKLKLVFKYTSTFYYIHQSFIEEFTVHVDCRLILKILVESSNNIHLDRLINLSPNKGQSDYFWRSFEHSTGIFVLNRQSSLQVNAQLTILQINIRVFSCSTGLPASPLLTGVPSIRNRK